MLLLKTWTEWRYDENDYGIKSEQSLGVHLGSDILRMTELPVGEIRSLNLGRVALVRKVSYIPSGIYGLGKHRVEDNQFTLGDFDRIEEGEIGVGSQVFRALKSTARQARKDQNTSGYSIPSEETYAFILDALRQGEKATRQSYEGNDGA